MIYKFISRLLTKKYTKVPLFWVTFNLKKFKQSGADGSCMVNLHPTIQDDNFVQSRLKEIVNYIREIYDMEGLSKV